MRKVLLLAFCTVGIMAYTFGQTLKISAVPAKVKDALTQKYPVTKQFKVTWEKEDGNYEANWGGKDGEANAAQFSPSGEFVLIEKAIATTQLPPVIREYLQKNYKGYRIHEAAKVTDAAGTLTYELEVKGKTLVMNPSGQLIKTEKGD